MQLNLANLHTLINLEDGNYELISYDNGHKLEAFAKIKKNSKKLVVFFQGAIDRNKHTPPIYNRWSWSRVISENVICLNDPLLYKSELLRIGWYTGAHNFDYIKKYNKFVKKICKSRNIDYKNVLFFGSSAGGFAAIALGTIFRQARVIVNNPQTNILKYYKNHVNDYLNIAFPKQTAEDVERNFSDRIDLVSMFTKYSFIPQICYYQNVLDKFHYKNHFIPFITQSLNTGIDMNISINLYSDEKNGHNPIGREESLKIINKAVSEL